jgi:hypothetical protein
VQSNTHSQRCPEGDSPQQAINILLLSPTALGPSYLYDKNSRSASKLLLHNSFHNFFPFNSGCNILKLPGITQFHGVSVEAKIVWLEKISVVWVVTKLQVTGLFVISWSSNRRRNTDLKQSVATLHCFFTL